jgi:hypothetical protein
VAAHVFRHQDVKVADGQLMARVRGWDQDELAFVQLVSAAVVRQRGVVVVGQDDSRRHRFLPTRV